MHAHLTQLLQGLLSNSISQTADQVIGSHAPTYCCWGEPMYCICGCRGELTYCNCGCRVSKSTTLMVWAMVLCILATDNRQNEFEDGDHSSSPATMMGTTSWQQWLWECFNLLSMICQQLQQISYGVMYTLRQQQWWETQILQWGWVTCSVQGMNSDTNWSTAVGTWMAALLVPPLPPTPSPKSIYLLLYASPFSHAVSVCSMSNTVATRRNNLLI